MNLRKYERESGLDIYGLGRDREKWEAAMTRFAEIIILECADVVSKMADSNDSDDYFWTLQNASRQIKDHFGVQE